VSSCLCIVVWTPVLQLSRKIMVTLVSCVFGRVEVESEMVRLGRFWVEGRYCMREWNAG
jgi:hypothetical protein